MAANYGTINVSSHILVKLELRSSNYTKWKSFFESLCGKFSLLAHIEGTLAPDPTTDVWRQVHSCIRSWLYGSVDSSVLDFTMEPDQTARQPWAAIEDHFTAN
jgi:hypothetical protein